MKYKLTKAEQETVINFDNELDTASIYTHDSRLIKKLRELRKQYPVCISFFQLFSSIDHAFT